MAKDYVAYLASILYVFLICWHGRLLTHAIKAHKVIIFDSFSGTKYCIADINDLSKSSFDSNMKGV